VQSLAQRTVCWLSLAYTKEFPEKLKCKVRIGMKDGQIFEIERDSFDGYFRSPMTVDALLLKFKRLGTPVATDAQLQRIIECVARLEQLPASDLAQALEQARVRTDGTEARRPQTAVA
jgi:2-methylcitrate dehydratase PrpD